MSASIFHLPSSDACVRRVGTRDHTLVFANGDVWMSPLDRYRKMGATKDGTGDPLEGIRFFEYEGERFRFTSATANAAVILSVTALVDEALVRISNENGRSRFIARSDYIDYSSRCARYGQEMCGAVFSASDLISRFKNYAASRNLQFKSGLIKYTDAVLSFAEYNRIILDGSIVDETLFRKRTRYSNQHEYRFMLAPRLEDIKAGKMLSLNEKGFYVAELGHFDASGIEMCF